MMKRSAVILLTQVLTLSASGQVSPYRLDLTVSKKKFADTIRIEYERERVIVPVGINGREYRFLLDTGASCAVMYEDVQIDGCTPLGAITSYDSNNAKTEAQVVRLPPLTIGSLVLEGCRATVQRRIVKRQQIDGILGFDIVNKGFQMKIDARANLLILTDIKDFFRDEGGFEQKYKLQYHVPYITVSPFKDYQENVLFDTGSRQLYAINKESFCRGEAKMENTAQIEGRSIGRMSIGFAGVESKGQVVFLGLDSISIGGFSLKDVHTTSTQGGSHVGAALLEYGAVVFNPQKMRFSFLPYNKGSSCEVGNEQMEKAVIPSADGSPMIGLVWERSEAYKAGFREGDVILEADGKPVGSFLEYTRYRPVRGQVYTFTVKDQRGFKKQVKAKW